MKKTNNFSTLDQLFYAPEIATIPELPEEESQHCLRVLRLKTGDSITITDGKGFFYRANIENDRHPNRCQVSITNCWPQKQFPDFDIHMAVAPPKNMDRMEWFVEKATEIGVSSITCLQCRYSERKEIKLQRLNKIAISAMKQSQKACLPKIAEMVEFNVFISLDFDGVKMIAHCADHNRQLIKNVYIPNRPALILIGPEGDFCQEEISAALAAGFTPVSLGESRLRTETAALVACHTIHLLNY